MKSLHDAAAYEEIIARIHKLNPQSSRLWGKMTVSQMLAHLSVGFRFPLSDKPSKRAFMGLLLSWMFKPHMYDDSPWKQGAPTGPQFIIKDERDFEKEKEQLLSLIAEFRRRGPEGTGNYPHPFFGTFTKEQWGKMQYKHADHHLKQFGV